jgi:hypothetical protein
MAQPFAASADLDLALAETDPALATAQAPVAFAPHGHKSQNNTGRFAVRPFTQDGSK